MSPRPRRTDEIEGIENPTLVLKSDEEYTIGWDRSDDALHNIELGNEDGDVDDYESPIVADPDDDQRVTSVADSSMRYYVCKSHSPNIRGEIVVE